MDAVVEVGAEIELLDAKMGCIKPQDRQNVVKINVVLKDLVEGANSQCARDLMGERTVPHRGTEHKRFGLVQHDVPVIATPVRRDLGPVKGLYAAIGGG